MVLLGICLEGCLSIAFSIFFFVLVLPYETFVFLTPLQKAFVHFLLITNRLINKYFLLGFMFDEHTIPQIILFHLGRAFLSYWF